MSPLLPTLRRLLYGSDARRAVAAEAELLQRERGQAGALDAKVARYFASDDNRLPLLGTAIESGQEIRVPVERLLKRFSGIWAPTGAGKSYLLCSILSAILRGGVHRLVLADPKSETVSLMAHAICAIARELPTRAAQAFTDNLVVINLFSSEVLPRLNICALAEGQDPELHIFELTLLLTAELGQEVGVRQEAILHRAVEICVRAVKSRLAMSPSKVLTNRSANGLGPSALTRAGSGSSSSSPAGARPPRASVDDENACHRGSTKWLRPAVDIVLV